MMSKCPHCDTQMHKESREILAGMFAEVDVCPNCKQDEWVDAKDYERLRLEYRRKTFKNGGSIAVRIPKEVSEVVGLDEGDEISIHAEGKKIVIEKSG